MPLPEEHPDAVLLRAIENARGARASRDRWLATARPEQLTPIGDWYTWLILAGRGWGKSRTGAEDLAWFGQTNPGTYLAVVAPNFAAGRDVCIEGESGLLKALPPGLIRNWNRSHGQLVLTNETRIGLFSAEEPDNLRGPQFHRAWGDELAAWPNLQKTWDNLQFGLRLGSDPRCVVTTTPKPLPLIRELVLAPTTHITSGTTFDNASNLAPAALAKFRAKYEGTRLGRQELNAEILEDVAGALWTRQMIEAARPTGPIPAFRRVVVAVDPSGSDGTSGDAQGIVVAAEGVDGRGYVLADETVTASPEEWASRVAFLFHKHEADRVVAEKNYGGAMVEAVLRAAAPNLPVTLVTASRGKAVRAEPISALYEQGRITHVEPFPELEDEMVMMTGAGYAGSGSPNRLDAMVWAFTELVLSDNAQGYIDYMREQVAEQDGALADKPQMITAPPFVSYDPATATATLGEPRRAPNTPPALRDASAEKLRMLAPVGVTRFELMPEGVAYVVGAGRVVEVLPEHAGRMRAQGCKEPEPVQ